MPISYSETSSEGPEMDMGWAYADATFGIPDKCFCGRVMILESSTGAELGTPGRKYYTCYDWLNEASGEHKWQWWDDAVTDEFSIVQRKFQEQREMLLRVDRLQVFDPTIGEIKEEIRLLQEEVSRLKEHNANQGEGYMMLLFLFVFAAISYMFK